MTLSMETSDTWQAMVMIGKRKYIVFKIWDCWTAREWGDLDSHSNRMILKVTIEMSDHPSVVDKAEFYPEFAVQIGDKIITSNSK